MLIVNDQEVVPSSITKDKVTDIQDGRVTVPIQSIEVEEIMKEPSTNISSLNQAFHTFEEQPDEHTDSDSATAILSEILNNPNKNKAIVETTDFSAMQIHNRNPSSHEVINSRLPDSALISGQAFPESIETIPEIVRFDQDSGAILNSQNKERNIILTTVTENSSFDDLISNAVGEQASSLDILNKSDENNSTDSNTYYPDKPIIRIMAKLNLLSPADEVIAYNGIQTLNSNQKEGRNLNLQMRHPLLELMIPKAKMNDFMMKINNTPVILRILHPEILSSETIPHIFKILDSDGRFSSEDFDSNYSSNLSNILDIFQPIIPKYSKDFTSASPSKTVKIGPLNNAVDQIIVPIANSNKIITNFNSETLNSDLFDEKNNLNNSSLFQKESENIAKMETDSSFAYPDVQESRVVEFPTRDQRNTKQMVDIQLLNTYKLQDTDKNEPKKTELNNFHAYVASVIHNNAFPEKNVYKSRTKVQPIDINEFYNLIDKSQQNDEPNGYEIVQNIANTLNGENLRFPRFKLNDSEAAGNLNDDISVPNQEIRFDNSFDLPSSIQYVVMPYDASNAAVISKYEHN
ncbi:hypothetical protein AVEN_238543-1 [Araneus ventricosus]|uniref:Uncharacterized protein n=1 Tax=Araneus ventricosus TaxID=182803 RepID=A0A4Y2I2U7_ARAVE|nr:hypothetical protein AVEN_238543-1 [Araneus ventricosus]